MPRARRIQTAEDPTPDRWSIEREVRERAYERHLERMRTGEEGDPFRDWVAAEADLAQAGAKTRR